MMLFYWAHLLTSVFSRTFILLQNEEETDAFRGLYIKSFRIVYFKNKPEMHENNMYLKLNIQFKRVNKTPLFWNHPI